MFFVKLDLLGNDYIIGSTAIALTLLLATPLQYKFTQPRFLVINYFSYYDLKVS